MDRKQIDMEKAWEQALGNIFQPYTGTPHEPTKAMDTFGAALNSSSYEIRRHLARTAARQGSTALNQFLADEYWGKRPY
jgi:hypothetical protein